MCNSFKEWCKNNNNSNNNNNKNNVHFNAIILTGRDWRFFALICSPHFSRYAYASSLLKPYRSRSFFYTLFPQFPWWNLLHFPSLFKLHNLTYWGFEISMDDMTMPPHMALHYHIFDLHNNTYPIPKNIILHPIDQSQPHVILIIRCSTPRNLASATVSSHISRQ